MVDHESSSSKQVAANNVNNNNINNIVINPEEFGHRRLKNDKSSTTAKKVKSSKAAKSTKSGKSSITKAANKAKQTPKKAARQVVLIDMSMSMEAEIRMVDLMSMVGSMSM